MTTTPRTTYDRVAIILHWLMAILLIGMLLLGEDMMEIEKEIGEDHGEGGIGLINLHVNIGIAILVLTVLRIVWRIANPPPALPDTVKPWEKKTRNHHLWSLLCFDDRPAAYRLVCVAGFSRKTF